MKGYWLVTLFLFFTSLFSITNQGASWIDDEEDITVPDVESMIKNLEYSALYQNIELLSKDQIVKLIDTLFEADSVPIDFINELNLYIAHVYSVRPIENKDLSPYPANKYYNSWNTEMTNPYQSMKIIKDTSFIVSLKDDEFNCSYSHPFPGIVTSNFGWRDGKNHFGIDIDLVTGDSVRNTFAGMIRVSRRHGGYGNVVIVRHYNGLETTYAHLSKLLVRPGDVVDPGQVLGLGGNTGRSTGSHLHFEVRFRGKAINPKNMINFRSFCLISDSIKMKSTRYGYTAYPVGQEFYVVKSGDFLYKIAEEYGATVAELCAWNGIRRNTVLRVGQRIRIEPFDSN